MIQTQNLYHRYQDAELRFPDIQLEAQGQLLITGSSGSGKSTLLHILAGLRKPTSGVVTVNQHDLYALTERKRDQFRGRTIGVVFQQPYLLQALSVAQNIAAAQYASGQNTNFQKITELLEALDISGKEHQTPDKLSVGQQQRVAIARALAISPSVIIADEPTSSLDDKRADQVIQLLTDTAKSYKCTLLVTTHDQRIKSAFANHMHLAEVA